MENFQNKISDNIFWKIIIKNKENIDIPIKKINYLLNEFGTKELCNRFDVGNTIEFIIIDYLKLIGFNVNEYPNEKRIDLTINNDYNLSIKFSSIGEITLHNSNSCINKDETMSNLFVITLTKLYLITNKSLVDYNINIKDYLRNAGDSLKLRRSLLTKLEKEKYPYIMDFKLNYDKNKCKNRLCSKVFYKEFINEFDKIYLTK